MLKAERCPKGKFRLSSSTPSFCSPPLLYLVCVLGGSYLILAGTLFYLRFDCCGDLSRSCPPSLNPLGDNSHVPGDCGTI